MELVSEDGSHQQQWSHSRMFPNMAATSVCVLRVSHSHTPPTHTHIPLQETAQDQQVGLAQAPIKLLLLTWVPVRIRFCVHPFKSEVSFALSPMGLLKLSRSGLQSHML